MLIQRYQQMVKELYCAPKEEAIMGSFLEHSFHWRQAQVEEEKDNFDD